MAPSEAALNRVLYALLVVVGYLFVKEIQRAYERRQQALWDDRYIDAVRSSPEEWKLGWRLEDLESRLHSQRRVADALVEADGDVQHLVSAVAGHEEEVEHAVERGLARRHLCFALLSARRERRARCGRVSVLLLWNTRAPLLSLLSALS